MRVFCPEHKRGFLAPRQSPIKCENSGHILGELDFAGEGKAPAELQWQYCCNCEHFCKIDFAECGLERCPVCTRRSSLVYLCSFCYALSFESNTPIQTKNFTLTTAGVPQPSCPGCLRAASPDLREHTCDEIGASFITALNSCPICQERLDIGPSFPSSLSHYLRRTKAANKLEVTFDYESQLFVPVEDGEFILISNGAEATQPIVLPRSVRFETRRVFYEFYQDHYHCAKPEAGEVHIIEPAAVAAVADGWRFQATGVLEVVEDQPKKRSTTALTSHPGETSAHEEGQLSSAAAKQPVAPCTHCGSLIETRYTFCWQCGHTMTVENESALSQAEGPGNMRPTAEMVLEDDEQTVQHEPRPPGSQLFTWAQAKGAAQSKSVNRSVLKLAAVAVVGLALVSLGLSVLTGSPSRMASTTANQGVTSNAQPAPSTAPAQEAPRPEAVEALPPQTATSDPEDQELKKLHERQIAGEPSAQSEIFKTLVRAERKYPDDYRFPYQRAKLAIRAREANSHHEAFAALSRAAEKAINRGKAREMLESLEADKAGDFRRLSHGHREWTLLQEALKSKDARVLNAKMGLKAAL